MPQFRAAIQGCNRRPNARRGIRGSAEKDEGDEEGSGGRSPTGETNVEWACSGSKDKECKCAKTGGKLDI